jgi:hypothetical protein
MKSVESFHHQYRDNKTFPWPPQLPPQWVLYWKRYRSSQSSICFNLLLFTLIEIRHFSHVLEVLWKPLSMFLVFLFLVYSTSSINWQYLPFLAVKNVFRSSLLSLDSTYGLFHYTNICLFLPRQIASFSLVGFRKYPHSFILLQYLYSVIYKI